MLDHEGNIIEKEDRIYYTVDSVVVPNRWIAHLLWGEIEARVINKHLEDITLHNSDILVKETEEHRSAKEGNIEANAIGNLS